MNEIIRKLAEQAGATAMGRSGYTDYGTLDLDVEKFAELIVRVCVNEIHAVELTELIGKSYYLDKVAEHIEKHFGVEE